MASDTHDATQSEIDARSESNEQLLTWLSALGGGGIIVMMIAAGIGVINPDIESGVVGLLVLAGAGALVMAIAGWTIVVQPYKYFDDINQPLYGGHVEASAMKTEAIQEAMDDVPSAELLDSPGEVDVTEPPPVDQDVTDAPHT